MTKFKIGNYKILLVLILICAFLSIMNPARFFTIDNLFTVVRQGSMMGIVAVGMTFVMLVGGFDLSVGTMQGLTGVLVTTLTVKAGVPIWLAIIITLLVGGMVGLINGIIVTRLKVNAFITTLSMMTIIKGISFAATGAFPITGVSPAFNQIGQGYIFRVIPIPVIIMIVTFILGSLLLNKTYIGRYFYSIGGNQEAARLSGINVKNIKLLAFVLCSFLASLSGVVLASRLASGQPAAGTGFEFDVITACVLGGVSLEGGEGKLTNVFAGVLIMGVLSNGMIMLNIDEYYQWIVKGVVLIVAVALEGINSYFPRNGKVQNQC